MNDPTPGASRPPMPVDIQPVTAHPAITSRFKIDELIPLKGLWFRVADIQGLGMALIATELTERARQGRTRSRGKGGPRRHPAS